MKTITMDYDEYLSDLEKAKEEGRVEAIGIPNLHGRLMGVLKVFNSSIIDSEEYKKSLEALGRIVKEAKNG